LGIGTKTLKIFDVNKQLTVPAGTFTVVGAVETSKDTLSIPKRTTLDKNWYSEGNGFIRTENSRISTYASGKTQTYTSVVELISITKP